MPVIAASEVHGLASTHDKQLKIALGQWLDSPPRRIDRLILQYLLAAAPPGAEKEPGQAITKAERQQARKDLLAYCGLDTEAMVEVVKSLK